MARTSLPEQKTFRPYQADLLRDLTSYLGQSSEVVLSAPTGAGKTLILQGLVTNIVNPKDPVPNRFKGAVVAVPQIQIEDGFSVEEFDREVTFQPEEGDMLHSCPLVIRTTDWVKGRDREHEGKTCKKFLLHLKSPRVKAMITTHQAISLWFTQHIKTWPSSLKDRLLVIDESHLAGQDNKLGQVAKLWVERGGKVVYATATPWRTDGRLVAPDNNFWAVRTLAEHIDGGEYAPGKLDVRTHLTCLRAETAAQVAGDRLGRGDTEASCADTVRLWDEDGRPKAVINVPLDACSREWAQALVKAFQALPNPPRVHNAVGTDLEVGQALQVALREERGVKRFKDSKVDVFIACRRFELGTDWPLCSHVYNIGLTSSFSRILQMLGRALRNKNEIEDYPERYRGLARFTFLIARSSKAVWADYFLRHTDHSYLLAIFMQDRKTGQTLLREVSRELGGHGPRPGRRETRIAYRNTVRSILNLLRMDEMETRHVVKEIVRAEIELEQLGRPTTNDAVLAHLTDRGADRRTIDAVVRFYGHNGSKRFKDAVARGMKALAEGCPARIIRRDLQAVFDAAIEEFGKDRSIVREGAFQHLAELSGRTAIEIADLMRSRIGDRESLSLELIDKAIIAYAKDHEGRGPNVKSGDATTYFGHKRTWVSVDKQLGGRGSSLAKRSIELGLEVSSQNYELTDEVIDKAIIAYAKDHEGRGPNVKSGDATTYFGYKRTWLSVAIQLGRRGSSLPKRSIELGLEVRSRNYELTDESIDKAIIAYAKDHEGRGPNVKSGDATTYFGYKRTWVSVDKQLGGRGSSLPKRSIELGLEVRSRNYELTDESIDKAIIAYAKDHEGRGPSAKSGDATTYFGYKRTWMSVDNQLGGRGSSLPKRSIELGLEVSSHNYELTDEVIDKAIIAYAKDHEGRGPNVKSGDATTYFGYKRTWVSVDDQLGGRGSSLAKRSIELGLEVSSQNYELTDEVIDKAIIAYAKDHEGRGPNVKSGDATTYFGYKRTWVSVDGQLGRRGSSLAKRYKSILTKKRTKR